jgi:hypothetical protein
MTATFGSCAKWTVMPWPAKWPLALSLPRTRVQFSLGLRADAEYGIPATFLSRSTPILTFPGPVAGDEAIRCIAETPVEEPSMITVYLSGGDALEQFQKRNPVELTKVGSHEKPDLRNAASA